MASIELKGLKKSYASVDVIKGVDLQVEKGEFVVFVGPSGCGKSTLLRMIAGLEDISAGELWIDGRIVNDLQPKDRGIAMVFQSYAIFPHMTVRENLGFGLTIAKAPKAEKAAKVQEAARILQMENLLDRRPSQLSGGQRQRVAIGRAIVRHPSVFLFDEPLSNLDAALRMDMRMEIGKLHDQLAATMVYVTHDQVEAMTLADKIVVLKEGRVQQIGAPMELYHHPANRFVAGFLGSPSMNFIPVDVVSVDGNVATVASPALDPVKLPIKHEGIVKGARAELGIRPQYLQPSTDVHAGKLHGTVALTERLGTETVINVAMEDGSKLITSLSEDVILDAGTKISLTFEPERAHLFATQSE